MPSPTDICNRALAAIGTRSTINDIAPSDGSNEANACALLYDPTRLWLLRASHWNFARRTGYLTLLKAAPGTPENTALSTASTWQQGLWPPPPWLYQYSLPSDYIRARYIIPQIATNLSTGQIPIFSTPTNAGFLPWGPAQGTSMFEIAGDVSTASGSPPIETCLTNQDQAIMVYTGNVTVVDVMDPSFQEALVCALAGKLVYTLAGDKALAKEKLDVANRIIIDARAKDANEYPQNQGHLPDWLAIRGAGSSWEVGNPGYCGAFIYPYGGLFY